MNGSNGIRAAAEDHTGQPGLFKAGDPSLFRNLIKIEETHKNEFSRLYKLFKEGKLYKTDAPVVLA